MNTLAFNLLTIVIFQYYLFFLSYKGTYCPSVRLVSLEDREIEDMGPLAHLIKVRLWVLCGFVPSRRGLRLPNLWIITSSNLHNTWALQTKSLWMWSKLSLQRFYYFHISRCCVLDIWRLPACLVWIEWLPLLSLLWFGNVREKWGRRDHCTIDLLVSQYYWRWAAKQWTQIMLGIRVGGTGF